MRSADDERRMLDWCPKMTDDRGEGLPLPGERADAEEEWWLCDRLKPHEARGERLDLRVDDTYVGLALSPQPRRERQHTHGRDH